MTPSLLDVFFFCVTRASNNHRLFYVVGSAVLADFCCGLIAVHNGHATVHQDHAVAEAHRVGRYEVFKCIKTIGSLVYDVGDFTLRFVQNFV